MRGNPYHEICSVGEKIHQQGFVAANDGNISVRTSKESFIITPTGVSKGDLKPEKLILVNGERFEGSLEPSSEFKMHRAIYKSRVDVRAVVHVHSPYATAFAMLGLGMEEMLFPEVIVTLGKIPLVPYRTPSTQAFADIVAQYAQDADALLLERHGIVALGSDLWDAYYKIERVEHIFKIISISRTIGTIKPLSEMEVADLIDAYPVSDRIRKLIG
ncbi:class II aldolase/adducin family protein [bacterium]|nr:class II aldolase/adducin family protein [bacterium]MBU1066088.1 class II aldolase/adducin family protein [bacterium]MBU1634079.1 class II aldolase/adducin family protein [bacterium]MBU1874512.1 class II aldolase/adducin family protein [bacterium]